MLFLRHVCSIGTTKGDPRSVNVTAWERNSGAVAVPSAYMRLVLPSDSYDEVEGIDGKKVKFRLSPK